MQDRRDDAWRRIVNIMGDEGHNVTMRGLKATWRGLRDTWKRVRMSKAGSTTTWSFFEVLKFLEINEPTDNEMTASYDDSTNSTSLTPQEHEGKSALANQALLTETSIGMPPITLGSVKQYRNTMRSRLIELVQKEEVLWDRRNEEFKLRDPRNDAWRRISSIMTEEGHNVTLYELKATWRGLRDQWKRLRACNDVSKMTWPFFGALEFLELNELTDNEETASRNYSMHNTSSIPLEREERRYETTGSIREEIGDIDVVGTSTQENVNTEDKYEYFGKLVTSVLRDYDKKVNEEFAMNKMEAIFSVIMSGDWAYGPRDHYRSGDAPQQCVPSPCRCHVPKVNGGTNSNCPHETCDRSNGAQHLYKTDACTHIVQTS
uniref:MADF domain-containing protein n=1 Tax=Haemonchus contortus TaxID=6289 RepID=A0A7I4XWV0_HAECO